MKTVKLLRVYGYNAGRGNMKGDVMCYDGSIYEEANFNPLDFDVTGQEEEQMEMCIERIKNGEENEGWEKGHVTAQIDDVEIDEE